MLSTQQAKVYQADGLVLLTDPRTDGTPATELSIFWNPTRYLENQVAVMESPNVMNRAAEDLGNGITADEIAEKVSVRSENDIDALTVTATSTDREEPIVLVNAVVQAYGEVISEEVIKNAEDTTTDLETSKAALAARLDELDALVEENPDDSALQAELQSTKEAFRSTSTAASSRSPRTPSSTAPVSSCTCRPSPLPTRSPPVLPATPPSRSSSPPSPQAPSHGGGPSRTSVPTRRTSPPPCSTPLSSPRCRTLATAKAWAPAPTITNPDSAASEAYHFALSSLSFMMEQSDRHIILVTSSGPGDGKTVTTLNLAIAAMKDGRKPLLIDADERAKGLTRLSGVTERIPERQGRAPVQLADHPAGEHRLRGLRAQPRHRRVRLLPLERVPPDVPGGHGEP